MLETGKEVKVAGEMEKKAARDRAKELFTQVEEIRVKQTPRWWRIHECSTHKTK